MKRRRQLSTKKSIEARKKVALKTDEQKEQSESSSSLDKLFSGLVFHLFPTNQKNKAYYIKRNAYEKAGATIIDSLPKSFGSKVSTSPTHIIVKLGAEKTPAFESLKQALDLTQDKPGAPLVVNDAWPGECISSNKLLDCEPFLVNQPAKVEAPETAKECKNSEDESVVEIQSDDFPKTQKKQQYEQIILSAPEKSGSNLKPFKDENASSKKDYTPPPLLDNNPNKEIIDIFSGVMHFHELQGKKFNALGYRRAISTLKRTMTPILTYKQAKELPGFGEKLARKVEEIVQTKGLKKLQALSNDESLKVRGMLEVIYGVGPTTSLKWYNEGVRTLEDVAKRTDLTDQQRTSLSHYHDFAERIPRDEVTRHYEYVLKVLKEIDPESEAYCMGSYRRGRQTCGDIDILITKKGVDSSKDLEVLLFKLICALFEKGFFTAAFSGPDARNYNCNVSEMIDAFHNRKKRVSKKNKKALEGQVQESEVDSSNSSDESKSSEGSGSDSGVTKKRRRVLTQYFTKWLGASCLEDVGKWRRLDLLMVPWKEKGAALIYFTGNDSYNRSLRILAKSKGYHLNEKGLFRIPGFSHKSTFESQADVPLSALFDWRKKKYDVNDLVEGSDERKILEILGVPWTEPEDRDI